MPRILNSNREFKKSDKNEDKYAVSLFNKLKKKHKNKQKEIINEFDVHNN